MLGERREVLTHEIGKMMKMNAAMLPAKRV